MHFTCPGTCESWNWVASSFLLKNAATEEPCLYMCAAELKGVYKYARFLKTQIPSLQKADLREAAFFVYRFSLNEWFYCLGLTKGTNAS